MFPGDTPDPGPYYLPTVGRENRIPPPSESEIAERNAAVARHGRTATAFRARSATLAWWSAGMRGGVAYAPVLGAWVAAGEPVAARDDVVALADAFCTAARTAGRRAVLFGTEGGLAHADGYARLRIGEQPHWDPSAWGAKVAAHRSLKEQLRRARAKGVVVRECRDPAERAMARSGAGPLADLLARWAEARPMATMHFMVNPEPFEAAPDRRLFVAERAGTPIALLSLVPMGADGWLGEHLVRAPGAPNGTAELLIDATISTVAAEGARNVSLGLAPLSGRLVWWLRAARVLGRPLFNFAGLAAFKRKLRPDRWRPIYLVYPAPGSAVRALTDALRSFADGSLTRFAFATLRRSPEWSLHLLEWLMIPWTLLLAAVPTERWFPSRGIHAAWVAFDIALLLLLRMRRTAKVAGLTRAAATAATIDSLLSLWQVGGWNLPRTSGGGAWAILAVSVCGPMLAALMLWTAAARERRAGVSEPHGISGRSP